MALNFTNLKDPKLGLTDKLLFGKFKDCRICDIVEEHYEYLIWAEKEGYVKFQQIVLEVIQDAAHFEKWESPEEPQKADAFLKQQVFGTYIDDDIPF